MKRKVGYDCTDSWDAPSIADESSDEDPLEEGTKKMKLEDVEEGFRLTKKDRYRGFSH